MSTATVEGDLKKVLLPPEVRLAAGAVDVQQVGDSVVLTPKKQADAWKLFEEAVGQAHDDFMPERVQPPHDVRDVSFE